MTHHSARPRHLAADAYILVRWQALPPTAPARGSRYRTA
jgi:hypothetical protein